MKPSVKKNRRDFLKVVAAGTAGFALSSPAFSRAASPLTAAWRAGLKINPFIDNFRVVSCYDENMIVNKIAGDFARQNEGVNTALIEENMDAVAIRLTLRASAAAAWNAIFQCPSGKAWNQAKIAIKVNATNIQNMPRTAVVGKVCKELIKLGALASNITIYDSCSNAWGVGKYTDSSGNPVTGIPSGVVVSNTDRTTDTGPLVPIGSSSLKCSSVIAQKNPDNSISYLPDIIINCAVNMGDLDGQGGFAMAMNNHIGTIKFDYPAAAELIDINQSEAIIGQGTSAAPCRQQLCIIDSLWASTTGPLGAFTHVPCRITMGTLAPVVDYLVAEKIRKRQEIMNVACNTAVVNSWLAAFGYLPSDPVWIELTPSTDITHQSSIPPQGTATVRVSLTGSGGRTTRVEVSAPHGIAPVTFRLLDLQGRAVRTGTIRPTGAAIIDWNASAGSPLPSGRYALKCQSGTWVKTIMVGI